MKRVFHIIGVLAAVAAVLLPAGSAFRRERAAAGAAGPRGVAAGSCTPGRTWGISRPGLAAEVVAVVNAHRRALGLQSLRVVPTLSRAARWKALHMAHYIYMSHDDPA
ncbi:MAG: hypothetical protein WBB74_09715, partial [Gaiellaceae bacterium]